MISIIVAMAKNRVVGNTNDLPWYLPADLRHFKQVTLGKTVVMGRKTFDSIIKRLGKPLPDRTNIVLTRDPQFTYPNVQTLHNFAEILRVASTQDIFVIGGAEVYAKALAYAQKLYLTEVDAEIAGDTFFPEINYNQWHEIARETHHKDNKNPYNYSFVILTK